MDFDLRRTSEVILSGKEPIDGVEFSDYHRAISSKG